MVRQSRRHRGRARPPLLGRPRAMGGQGLRQRLAQGGVREAEIVIRMVQGELLPHAVLALAECTDPSSHGGHMLADGEVDPLDEDVSEVLVCYALRVYESPSNLQSNRVTSCSC